MGGFESIHDLVTCGGCQANQEACMCTLRASAHQQSKGLRVKQHTIHSLHVDGSLSNDMLNSAILAQFKILIGVT